MRSVEDGCATWVRRKASHPIAMPGGTAGTTARGRRCRGAHRQRRRPRLAALAIGRAGDLRPDERPRAGLGVSSSSSSSPPPAVACGSDFSPSAMSVSFLVRLLLFAFVLAEQFDRIVVAENLCRRHQRSVGGDLVVLDALRRRDQPRIEDPPRHRPHP